ncbi:hypothetical protein GYMLUDRAFT_49375 [Collybiopsis luxurians FD-317 M1]|uniref:Uncharacterized protein n=1 Tax=Collybiopsis luxurians FD-317 M1 TaxID=944289 RepID=A0A0D0BUW8_9AGAR|nr:hypothetical protein GYMLUDRAFT_49375 [Collybiopsis luxurians FD-317 M1]
MSSVDDWIAAFALIAAILYAYSRWFTVRSLYHTVTRVDQLLQNYENEPVSKSTLSFEACQCHRKRLMEVHARIGTISSNYNTKKLCWMEYLSLIRVWKRLRAIFSCYMRIRKLWSDIELSAYQQSNERYCQTSDDAEV